MPSRPWDVRELDAGNVRRLNVRNGSDDPDLPTTAKILRFPRAESTAEINQMFRQSPAATKDVIRELARLGYDLDEVSSEAVALVEVGRSRMTITLFLSDDFPIEIVRVHWGHERWTARQAATWLHSRASR